MAELAAGNFATGGPVVWWPLDVLESSARLLGTWGCERPECGTTAIANVERQYLRVDGYWHSSFFTMHL